MPRKMVYAAWDVFRDGNDQPVEMKELRAGRDEQPVPYRGNLATTDEQLENAVKEEFCRPLAVTFQVSPEAMRIRLEELKLLVAKKDATLF